MSSPSPTVATLYDYQYLGCYTDTPRRLLDAAAVSNLNMTAQFCADYCNGAISPARFYPFVGVEDGAQCFCGAAPSSPLAGAAASSPDIGCGSPCVGNNLTLCGGGWFINVYSATRIPPALLLVSSTGSVALLGGATATAAGNASSSAAGSHVSGATIGVAVLAALFGLAALGAAALWFFARRRRTRRLSAQAAAGVQDASKAWSPVQFQPQYQAQYQPPVELGNQIRPPVELSTGQPEQRV
jgi:hypothetical protein